MPKHLVSLATAVLAVLSMGAAQQTPPADPLAGAPRISAAEAKKALDAGKAVLVDVRPPMAFQAEHAKGAINIPLHEVNGRARELPKDRQIITYCT